MFSKKKHKLLVISLGNPHSINTEILIKSLEKLNNYIKQSSKLDDLLPKVLTVLIGSKSIFDQQLNHLSDKKIIKNIELIKTLKTITTFNYSLANHYKQLTTDTNLAQKYQLYLHHLSQLIQNIYNQDKNDNCLNNTIFIDITPCQNFNDDISLNKNFDGLIAKKSLYTIKLLSDYADISDSDLSVLTLPVQKKSLLDHQYPFVGQTEFFSDLWSDQGLMVLYGDHLCVALITHHIAISQLKEILTIDLVYQKLVKYYQAINQIYQLEKTRDKYFCDHLFYQKSNLFKFLSKSDNPKIILAGVNPHLSDDGLYGSEEQTILIPALNRFSLNYHQFFLTKLKSSCYDLLSADSGYRELYLNKYCGLLSPYHDQALAAFKMIDFDSGVNITSTLKYLRLAPDHGPASNLFLKGIACDKSLFKALTIAYTNLI